MSRVCRSRYVRIREVLTTCLIVGDGLRLTASRGVVLVINARGYPPGRIEEQATLERPPAYRRVDLVATAEQVLRRNTVCVADVAERDRRAERMPVHRPR